MRYLTLASILALLAGLAAPADARDVRSFDRHFAADDVEELSFEFPAGELTIEAASGATVEVDVTVACSFRKARCAEAAEGIDIVASERRGRMTLEVDGLTTWSSIGMELDVVLRAPANLELDVEAGAGSVHISGFENDISVEQGAGELQVRMDESRVDSADIDAGIGDVSIRHRGGRLEASGLFGNELSWDDGDGLARVRLELGVGEVALKLQ